MINFVTGNFSDTATLLQQRAVPAAILLEHFNETSWIGDTEVGEKYGKHSNSSATARLKLTLTTRRLMKNLLLASGQINTKV